MMNRKMCFPPIENMCSVVVCASVIVVVAAADAIMMSMSMRSSRVHFHFLLLLRLFFSFFFQFSPKFVFDETNRNEFFFPIGFILCTFFFSITHLWMRHTRMHV